MAMATRAGGGLRALCMSPADLSKDPLLLNGDTIQSPSAGHLPHSSDDSSATVRVDINSLKGCSSPSSELEQATLSPTAAGTTETPRPPHTLIDRSPAPSPVTPFTRLQASERTAPTPPAAAASGAKSTRSAAAAAAAAAAAVAVAAKPVQGFSSQLEPLRPPHASEGPEAAAEYAAYKKRWEAGTTLAQRWSRLVASGKVSTIEADWDDLHLDILLQTHCSNTPQAAAARAAAAAAAAAADSAQHSLRSPKSGSRRTRSELEIDAALAEFAVDDTSEGAAMSPGLRRVRSRQAPKSFRDFEVDLPAGTKSSSESPEPAAAAAAAAAFSPAGGPHEMDAYIGAGILLDLHQSGQPAKQQQQQSKALQKPKQQQQQQQRAQGKSQIPIKQLPAPLQQQYQQQQQQLPVLQTRPKIALVLDLSESPKHSNHSNQASPAVTAISSPSRLSGQQQQQRHQLHLGLPSGSTSQGATPSPTAQHMLPPRPPRMPHHHPHASTQPLSPQQQQLQQQQQQQQADLNPEHIQAALQVASKLGAALGNNSAAFARIMSFVNQNSNKPAALYQFMAATLADLEGSNAVQPAAAAAAAAAPEAAAAAGSLSKQPPRGLML